MYIHGVARGDCFQFTQKTHLLAESRCCFCLCQTTYKVKKKLYSCRMILQNTKKKKILIA